MNIEHDKKSCLHYKGVRKMNYGEGRAFIELISSIVTLFVYGLLVVLGLVNEWFVIGDVLQFWAIIILIFIPISNIML